MYLLPFGVIGNFPQYLLQFYRMKFLPELGIAHTIKWYVRIGCNVVEESDIVTATKHFARTYLANIEPNRHQQTNLVTENPGKKKPHVETIAGISKYNFWQWPIAGPLAEYIVACPLPHFGASVHFSPAMITSLCNEEISRPIPVISTHTEPQSKWKMASPKPQDKKVSYDLHQ
ncbi:4197_t:CDS:2 [Gigaspora rosea]|nr:4197_t:CDS:2 [Gigaspora rosea]